MRRLATLVHATGSVVAISSNWRLFRELKARLTLALQNVGNIRVIGATPDHGERQHGSAVRPEEIISFIKTWRCALSPTAPLPIGRSPLFTRRKVHPREKGVTPTPRRAPEPAPGRRRRGAPIETWCAVDDRPLHEETGGKYLEGHFVQVHERHGLTDRACERMSAILLPEPDEPELMSAMLAGAAGGGMVTPPRKWGAASAYGVYEDGTRASPDTVLGALTPTTTSSKGGTPTSGTPKGGGTPLKPSTPDSAGRRTPLGGGGGGTLATPGNYRELQQRLLNARAAANSGSHGGAPATPTPRSNSSPAARPPPSPSPHHHDKTRAELLTPRTGGFPVPRLTGLRASPPLPSPPLFPGGFSAAGAASPSAGRAPLAPAPRRPPPQQRQHSALQRPTPGMRPAPPPGFPPPSLASRSRFGSAGASGRADALPTMVR